MDERHAINSLGALAHPKRLEAFRRLVAAGGRGTSSGELATELGLQPSTMSVNLQRLAEAGLVTSERQGKVVRYYADLEGAKILMQFLLEDCCCGRPEICGDWLAELASPEGAETQDQALGG